MKLRNKILSVFLALVSVFTFATTALAAPSRNTGTVNYLSEVAVIEAKNIDEAKKVFEKLKEEKNGAFTGLIETDLNEGGKNKVYLAYKTSTNVDDAITDLSVMNMNGNFSVGNYEKLLSDTISKHEEVALDYIAIAQEFAANYNAGYENAKIAHRQMNYYFIEKNGEKIYMGDYMLNFTEEKKTEFAEFLFKGNLNIIANIRSLMAMAVGKADSTLAGRIEAAYKEAETNPSIYENSEYKEAAKSLLEEIQKNIDNINQLPSKCEELATPYEDENDENTRKALLAETERAIEASKSFIELMKRIPLNDTNLGDFLFNKTIIEEKDLYPIVHAGTEAEKLLMEYQSFNALLLYDVLEDGIAAVENQLIEFEKEFTPISIFHGVQNDLTSGTIGVTGDAEIVSSTTGKSFIGMYGNSDTAFASYGYTAMGLGGVLVTAFGAAFLYIEEKAAQINYKALQDALEIALEKQEKVQSDFLFLNELLYESDKAKVAPHLERGGKLVDVRAEFKSLHPVQCRTEVENLTEQLESTSGHISVGYAILGSAVIVLGVVLMVKSINGLIETYNKYTVSYTDIPDNMVDVVSDDVNGDRFINYKNVPSFRLDGETLKSRENDLNGYNGKEWVSLYYTKNYEAGKCLTATPDFVAGSEAKDGYSPIHLFGHTSNYNLNSFCNRKDASEIYLSFKYSVNKKSADTDVPEIIGSSFNAGYVAISGFAGLALGMAVMGFIKRKKKDEVNEKEQLEN